jgi:hypothetical protein
MSKIGVLEYRYGRPQDFEERVRADGRYAVNVGDWIQTLAVESLLERIGVPRSDLVRVDRNALPSYRGPPVRLVMNACFFPKSFPIPSTVDPVFVGFQTSSPEVVDGNVELFRRHQPIGCRDAATRDLLRARGVDAYVTGCLTSTLPRRTEPPPTPKTFFVAGESAGAMPKTLARHVPAAVGKGAVHRQQREAVTALPLSDADAARLERIAADLLATYRRDATLIVTPLLHAASPATAMGIPVVLARKDRRDRFTAIDHLLPVYTPGYFHAIDWAPTCPDTEGLKACLESLVGDLLGGRGVGEASRTFLAALYETDAGPTSALWASTERRDDRWTDRIPFVRRWRRRAPATPKRPA